MHYYLCLPDSVLHVFYLYIALVTMYFAYVASLNDHVPLPDSRQINMLIQNVISLLLPIDPALSP